MKPSTGTLVRTAMMALALINLFVSTTGVVPEEVVGDSQSYMFWSAMITAVMGVVNTWKNNSFTPEAIEADQLMHQKKEEAKAAKASGKE